MLVTNNIFEAVIKGKKLLISEFIIKGEPSKYGAIHHAAYTAEEAKQVAVRAALDGTNTYTVVDVCSNNTATSVGTYEISELLNGNRPLGDDEFAVFSDEHFQSTFACVKFAKACYLAYEYHEDAFVTAMADGELYIDAYDTTYNYNPFPEGAFTMLSRGEFMKYWEATSWGPITDESIKKGWMSLTDDEKDIATEIVKYNSFAYREVVDV